MPNELPVAGPCLSPLTLNRLALHGWSQQNLFLSDELTLALAAECRSEAAGGALLPAAVGRGAARAVRTAIRGDSILWLRPGRSAACDSYLLLMEHVRLALNQAFFLGLDSYESHFAHYAPGASYQKHLDRFRDDDLRTVSVVIYLNPDWPVAQGGALRLHPLHAPTSDVSPLGGRLVVFLSADMPHEVLPATHERLSLAGWFRRRPRGASLAM
ncbi:2OG-Fe(II) oxygenase [Duganella sp. BuS-21]|uniref:2OG-Fe(II) oxygenase n=1 Tax=Duganella sp. BuS-21 TaxID=2943848 RepID=UPI0035A66F11